MFWPEKDSQSVWLLTRPLSKLLLTTNRGLIPVPAQRSLPSTSQGAAGQGDLPALSPPAAVMLQVNENPHSNRVTPPTPSAAPEEPLPPAALTLVNDALCDEFALPPLVVTQRPPVENQALPELSPWVLSAPRPKERQQGHQGSVPDLPGLNRTKPRSPESAACSAGRKHLGEQALTPWLSWLPP